MTNLGEYIEYRKASGCVAATLDRHKQDIRQFKDYVNVNDQGITADDIKKYWEYLQGLRIDESTRVLKMRRVQGYLRYLVDRRRLLIDPSREIHCRYRRRIVKRDILSQDEVEVLLNAAGQGHLKARDQAMFEVLYSTGIRNGELRALRLQDINFKDREMHVRDSKTRKERMVPMGQKAAEALKEYLTTLRPRLVKDVEEQAVFLTQGGKRMQYYLIRRLFHQAVKRSGIRKEVTPYCLRHSCATHLMQNGAPIEMIQRLLGHQRVSTTEIYTQVTPEDLKREIARKG